ncbi:MAG: T9SS type A sorting domain-containing protein [Bacteroidota bacterium]
MNHKKTITSVAFLLLGLGGLHAQETVPATGGDASGSGGSSSYTVGQVVYTTSTGTNGSVAEGVQQPYEISTTVGIEVAEINLEFIAYPNPTNNSLTLNIGNYNNEKLTYQLYDMQGKLLANKLVVNDKTTIGMQDLPESTYLLNVLDNNSLIKTFRIIKIK